jgi:hypothetical protein
MVFMYGINALLNGWWEDVTLIIWGATASLVSENALIQARIGEAMQAGVQVVACKACADQLGVSDPLAALGVDVKYMGVPLTDILKNGEALLTI